MLFDVGVKPGLTRREEHRLRVFEIRVLRMISGPKRERNMWSCFFYLCFRPIASNAEASDIEFHPDFCVVRGLAGASLISSSVGKNCGTFHSSLLISKLD